jgi:hypothetical protein
MSRAGNSHSRAPKAVKRCPPEAEPCTVCDGAGGFYDGEEGYEWDCADCWGHGTREMQGAVAQHIAEEERAAMSAVLVVYGLVLGVILAGAGDSQLVSRRPETEKNGRAHETEHVVFRLQPGGGRTRSLVHRRVGQAEVWQWEAWPKTACGRYITGPVERPKRGEQRCRRCFP